MKHVALAILALALPAAGCSRNDRADAGDKAEHAAQEGGQALKNAGETLSDGGITVKVKSAMSLSSKLTSSGIDVDTKDRIVHVRGTVPDANQRALAERIASDTVGKNVQVVNELKIASSTPRKSP